MPHDPEPFSDAEVDATLRELAGDDLRRAGEVAGRIEPTVAAHHVRRAAHAAGARHAKAPVADLEVVRARRAATLVRRRRGVAVVAGWAAAGFVVLGGASTGLAAAEVLPRPAARMIASVVDAVGLPVPEPVERAAQAPAQTVEVEDKTAEAALGAAAPVERDEPLPAVESAPTTLVTTAAAVSVESVPTTAAPTSTTVVSTTTTAAPDACATTTTAPPSSSTTSSTSTTSTTAPSTSTTAVSATTSTGDACDAEAEGAGVDETTTTSTTAPPTTQPGLGLGRASADD